MVALDLSNSANILLSCSILAMIRSISVAIAPPPSAEVLGGRMGEVLPYPPTIPPAPPAAKLDAVVVVKTPEERELNDVTPANIMHLYYYLKS